MPSPFDVVLSHARERFPEKLAILTEEDGDRSYGELATNAARLGHALSHRLGLVPGTRVSICMPQRPQWIEANLGLMAAALSAVAGNPRWTDAEYAYVLSHSGARAVICDEAQAEQVLRLTHTVSSVEHVVVVGSAPAPAHSFDELLDEAPDDAAEHLPAVPEGSEGSLSYTSGTTSGRPKAVVMSQNTLSRFDFAEMFGLEERDRAITITPFFHGNGLSGVMLVLGAGASAVFPRAFSARRFWALVDRYRPTYMITLAPLMNILMSLPPSSLDRSHSFRVLVVLGSGPNMQNIEERYGVPVIDWYGMTEAGFGTYTRLGEERRPGSAGRLFPGTDMRIFREDGTEADHGEVGEVAFNTEVTGFTGYLHDEEATAAVKRGKWFMTGDLGSFDRDGYFYFADRKKDIVRRGGENISSAEVEAIVRGHPAVADVAVLGKPDPVLGERLVVCIVPRESDRPPSPEDLRAYCQGRIADFKIPEEVFEFDSLPRTGTGKIEKFRLREMIRSRPDS